MPERANITPAVLKWARVTAKMSETEAAAKVSVKPEKIAEWESGASQPSNKQKNWISDENKENGEPALKFVGRFTIQDNPEKVAKDILYTLGINPLEYTASSPLREWITKSEAAGIFVSRTSFIHTRMKINKEELQGFAIADPYAPYIFINSGDWKAPQLFTLVHELAHIWIAETGISNDTEIEIKNKNKLHPVELFCNKVAANALIPEAVFEKLPYKPFQESKSTFKLSNELGVSSYALIVRGLNLGLIDLNKFKLLRKQALLEFKKFLDREQAKREKQKEKSGGPSPYLLKVHRNSRLFTQIVLDGYRGGRIAPTLASSLLSVKSNKFHKLEERMYS